MHTSLLQFTLASRHSITVQLAHIVAATPRERGTRLMLTTGGTLDLLDFYPNVQFMLWRARRVGFVDWATRRDLAELKAWQRGRQEIPAWGKLASVTLPMQDLLDAAGDRAEEVIALLRSIDVELISPRDDGIEMAVRLPPTDDQDREPEMAECEACEGRGSHRLERRSGNTSPLDQERQASQGVMRDAEEFEVAWTSQGTAHA